MSITKVKQDYFRSNIYFLVTVNYYVIALFETVQLWLWALEPQRVMLKYLVNLTGTKDTAK